MADFEAVSQQQLAQAALNHADETGININGKRHWLHCTSNLEWTHFFPHQKRGMEAMDEAGILPQFKGVLCHDHWSLTTVIPLHTHYAMLTTFVN